LSGTPPNNVPIVITSICAKYLLNILTLRAATWELKFYPYTRDAANVTIQ